MFVVVVVVVIFIVVVIGLVAPHTSVVSVSKVLSPLLYVSLVHTIQIVMNRHKSFIRRIKWHKNQNAKGIHFSNICLINICVRVYAVTFMFWTPIGYDIGCCCSYMHLCTSDNMKSPTKVLVFVASREFISPTYLSQPLCSRVSVCMCMFHC